MKKLTFLLMAAILAANSYAATSYTITGTGSDLTLTITGTGDMPDYYYDYYYNDSTGTYLIGTSPWHSQRADIKTLVIENGVTSIGDYAFQRCSGLTSVFIPNSVTSIGRYAFLNCSGLTSVNIPNSVTAIGSAAFCGSGLTSVNIPNSITSFGDSIFVSCHGLISVNIPNSVTSIGYAFNDCSSLTSVTCNAIMPPTIENYTFYGIGNNAVLYVPCSSIISYQNSDWGNYFTNVLGQETINDTITIYENELPYLWHDRFFTETGTFADTVLNINGCYSIFILNLIVNPLITTETNDSTQEITLTLDVPIDVPITSGTFTVTLPEGISIDTINCALSDILAGNYILTITDNGDGSWTFTITPRPANAGLLRSITQTTNYQDIVHIAYNVPEDLADGSYTVIISDLHFTFEDETEINQDEMPVVINVGEQEMGVETLHETSLQIYPNPVNDELKIESVDCKINSVEIFDVSGRAVGAGRALPLHNGGQTINVSSLPAGVYLLKIKTDKGTKTERFIKK